MVLNKLAGLHHIQDLRSHLAVLGRPPPRIEGDTVDQAVRRHLLEGLQNSVFHIADRSDTARLLAAGKVLVVTHDHHIVGKGGLLLQVIIIIEIVGDIVVDGDNQARAPAGDTDLADKFHEILPVLGCQALYIDIDAVDLELLCLLHSLTDHPRSALERPQEFCIGDSVLVLEIIEDSPDLNISLVCHFHIFF